MAEDIDKSQAISPFAKNYSGGPCIVFMHGAVGLSLLASRLPF